MNESDVVEAVCSFLRHEGCIIDHRCSTLERGVEICASKYDPRYFIEAKGGTSSRHASARYGKGFNSSQVFDRVAKGFYTAACLRNEQGSDAVIGLAFPDLPMFRRYAKPLNAAVRALNVTIYWVQESKSVVKECT